MYDLVELFLDFWISQAHDTHFLGSHSWTPGRAPGSCFLSFFYDDSDVDVWTSLRITRRRLPSTIRNVSFSYYHEPYREIPFLFLFLGFSFLFFWCICSHSLLSRMFVAAHLAVWPAGGLPTSTNRSERGVLREPVIEAVAHVRFLSPQKACVLASGWEKKSYLGYTFLFLDHMYLNY